ncbi:hypothetical protein DFH11DRAFT_1877337 [Phellopilus nigrolimitatus]|nr:hypothetical protein DFH11DRAFT_1877337 [Phellopilus nigrolimitatus]
MGQTLTHLRILYNQSRPSTDLSGKVIIVTGGNTGVGKETILASRDPLPSPPHRASLRFPNLVSIGCLYDEG